jgi:cytochrome c peroxidase
MAKFLHPTLLRNWIEYADTIALTTNSFTQLRGDYAMKKILYAGFISAAFTIAGYGIAADDGALLEQAQAIFKPLPANAATAEYPITPERVALGKALFFETRVASDGTTSCGRCHLPQLYGTDALPKSFGAENFKVPRNAPTVLQFVQHYGGNRKDVEEQAKKAICGLAYGNKGCEEPIARLKAIQGYAPMFAAAFPNDAEPIKPDNWALAIGAYERTLISASPFDAYLKGDHKAIDNNAKRGLAKFIEHGCVGCHNGMMIGGGMYQKFGVIEPYWNALGYAEDKADKGRFVDTKDANDTYMFKVQTLRNVALTPPYFHDGSVKDLGDAVRIMARVQLGKKLPDDDVADIVAFLNSLTGPVPENFKNVPDLPVGRFAAN